MNKKCRYRVGDSVIISTAGQDRKVAPSINATMLALEGHIGIVKKVATITGQRIQMVKDRILSSEEPLYTVEAMRNGETVTFLYLHDWLSSSRKSYTTKKFTIKGVQKFISRI